MTRKLTRIFGALSLCVLTALVTLFGQGYVRYRRELDEVPLEEATGVYTGNTDYVSYEEIDEDFVHAVISVEDKRFFERKGYDLIALCRALYHNFLAKDFVEGGSTITEQIAKNLYMEGYVSGLEEKTAEIFILFALEKKYSKEELFALYANMNYYGDGYWGIREAAKGYYGCDPDDLSLGQATILAGIPNAPAIYQLSTGYDGAKERQEWVLQTMVNNRYISEEEMAQALAEDVHPIKKQQP